MPHTIYPLFSPRSFYHSSGAVSCLLAAALQGRGYSIDHVTVFGTPKFTDKKGAVRLVETLPIERVEHVMDPVSIAPMVRTYVQTRYIVSYIGRMTAIVCWLHEGFWPHDCCVFGCMTAVREK
jgi:hypothetical protein